MTVFGIVAVEDKDKAHGSWTRVKMRAFIASKLILDKRPGALDNLLRQKYGDAISSNCRPEFGQDILDTAKNLYESSDLSSMKGLPEAYDELRQLGLHQNMPEDSDFSRFLEDDQSGSSISTVF